MSNLEPGNLFWEHTIAHDAIQEFFKIEAYKEFSKLNFQSFSLLVANSHLEGGLQAKLKIFETLQKNLYDVISGNTARQYYATYFDKNVGSQNFDDNPDVTLLSKVNQF